MLVTGGPPGGAGMPQCIVTISVPGSGSPREVHMSLRHLRVSLAAVQIGSACRSACTASRLCHICAPDWGKGLLRRL
jgi:hypothetical protein